MLKSKIYLITEYISSGTRCHYRGSVISTVEKKIKCPGRLKGLCWIPGVTWTWTIRTSGALMKLVRDVSHKRAPMWLHVLTWLKPRAERASHSPRWTPDWLPSHFSHVLNVFLSLYLIYLISKTFSSCWQVRSWHRTTWVTRVWRCLSGVTVKAVGISCRSACASSTCSTATLACVSVNVPPNACLKVQHNPEYQPSEMCYI